ncbi:MAG: 50S ribosomal protein L25 [Candidatus Omnitrophica bacterium]|nr:50S ribosomal protein L25 [Candidatus Omnitrophota bacterium]
MRLEASVRPETGKKISRVLRRAGTIPGVVYGEGQTSTPIALTAKDLARVLRTAAGGNVLITLAVRADAAHPSRTVLIKEIQQHPVTAQVLHVDFQQVSLTKRIQVTVPLQFTGEAVGVTQDGGRLDHLLWEVKVECLPTEIPKRVDVDVSALKIGDSLLIKDLTVSAGVTLLHDPQVGVAACLPPVVEKAPEAVEGAPAEPEVITAKKPEAEEGAPAEAKAQKAEKAPEKPDKKPEK